jgi:CRP-like cAMP-binding protein
MVNKDVLKKLNFFRDFSDAELGKLAPLFSQRSYQADQSMIPERAESTEMMVLVEGKVAVEVATRLSESADRLVLTMELSPGRIIEWSNAFDLVQSGGTASARAVSDVTVLVAEGQKVYQLCIAEPQMGIKMLQLILQVLTSRLKDTRMQLVSMAAQCQ